MSSVCQQHRLTSDEVHFFIANLIETRTSRYREVKEPPINKYSLLINGPLLISPRFKLFCDQSLPVDDIQGKRWHVKGLGYSR